MWIEYNTGKPTLQWENQDTKEIIQSYGNDIRYPAFKAKIDSGEIKPVKWLDSDRYKEAKAKMDTAHLDIDII
jgi:hypothetical protein